MTPAGASTLHRRLALLGLGGGCLLGTWPLLAAPLRAKPSQRLQVGPRREIRSLAQAARRAQDGALIEVDAGDYPGDVASWPQRDLSLRAVGGRVRLLAQGAAAQGKGIFVTSGEGMRIEGFDFSGARVPDRNGAGLRMDGGSLHLLDCRFQDNEMGLLTGNDGRARLVIENCEFGPILPGQRHNHNLYVGSIAQLRISGSYLHHGLLGHLLKSRAAVNEVLYNRLSDEIEGRASYELEFPNGGQALVLGNLIQQSAGTENAHMVSFGAEGYVGERHSLVMAHNTWIDRRPRGGIYLRVRPAAGGQAPVAVRLLNNLFAGNRSLAPEAGWDLGGNAQVDFDVFVQANRDNYALRPEAAPRGRAVDPGRPEWRPVRQYLHPHGSEALPPGLALQPGAIQRP